MCPWTCSCCSLVHKICCTRLGGSGDLRCVSNLLLTSWCCSMLSTCARRSWSRDQCYSGGPCSFFIAPSYLRNLMDSTSKEETLFVQMRQSWQQSHRIISSAVLCGLKVPDLCPLPYALLLVHSCVSSPNLQAPSVYLFGIMVLCGVARCGVVLQWGHWCD